MDYPEFSGQASVITSVTIIRVTMEADRERLEDPTLLVLKMEDEVKN